MKRTHGLWEKTSPQAPVTEALRGAIKADVVIVGAGYTGLSAALHLRDCGIEVVVLEAAEVGFGGSGRNVGLVNAGMWIMPNDLPAILGRDHGERLLNLLGNAPDVVFEVIKKYSIDCEQTRTGTLHCAVGKSGLEEITRRAEQWQKRGAPVRVLNESETTEKVGSSAYSGALLDLRAGTIQPLAYVRGLATAAMASGAKVYSKSPVHDAERNGSRWIVRTNSATVEADWVVVATNAYTDTPWREIRTELVSLPYFNFATKPLPDDLSRSILPERQGAWDTKEVLSSFRFDRSGRLIFGSVGALRGLGTKVHKGWARRALKKLFPQIDGVEFETEWYGNIGMTTNNLPLFHKLDINVISISGYNGRGIGPGTVFGKVLAQYIKGNVTDDDMPLPSTSPRDASFRRLRELYYEVGAQAAHFAGSRI